MGKIVCAECGGTKYIGNGPADGVGHHICARCLIRKFILNEKKPAVDTIKGDDWKEIESFLEKEKQEDVNWRDPSTEVVRKRISILSR